MGMQIVTHRSFDRSIVGDARDDDGRERTTGETRRKRTARRARESSSARADDDPERAREWVDGDDDGGRGAEARRPRDRGEEVSSTTNGRARVRGSGDDAVERDEGERERGANGETSDGEETGGARWTRDVDAETSGEGLDARERVGGDRAIARTRRGGGRGERRRWFVDESCDARGFRTLSLIHI